MSMKQPWVVRLIFLITLFSIFGLRIQATDMPDTTNIILQKLQYTGINQDGTIQQDGLQKLGIPDGFEVYNPSQNGDVEFTLVDATDYVNNQKIESVEIEIMELLSSDYEMWIKENASVIERQNIGADGRIYFNNVDSTYTSDGKFRYYVAFETRTPERVKRAAQPALVQLPMTNSDETDYLENVYVYPKNQVDDDEPKVKKNVVNSNGDIITGKPSFSIGDTINYSVLIDIPTDINDYVTFAYSDEGQKGLTYRGDPEPKLYGKTLNGEHIELVDGIDYTYEKVMNGFEVEFITTAGDMSPNISKLSGGFIYLDYQMILNEEAMVGNPIDNSYMLMWKSSPNSPKKEQLGKTSVYTGGAKFTKEDAKTGSVLAGAEFVIKNVAGKYYSLNELDETIWVTEEKNARIFESDANGTFEVLGLAKDTYYLIETKSPMGYALLSKPIPFEITDTSYTSEIINVKNYKKSLLPATGYVELKFITVFGIVLLTISLWLYRKNAKDSA